MTEHGFQPLDGKGINHSGGKIFLIRLPKDLHISALNGMDLKLKTASSTTFQHEQSNFEITIETSKPYECMRPVVVDDTDGFLKVGPRFDGSIEIIQTFVSFTPKDEPIQIMNAYEKVHQVPGLRVHSLPLGSLSSLSDLKQKFLSKSTSSLIKSPGLKASKRDSDEVIDSHKKKKKSRS